jgi:putative ABC transport system permease protein
MWFKKIKTRKMQHFLIAFLIAITTAILLACVSFTMETKSFVDNYFQYDNCPLVFDITVNQDIVHDLERNPKVMNLLDRIDSNNAKYVKDEFYSGDRKLKNDSIFVHEIDDVDALGYDLPLVKGKPAKKPGTNEIWICHVYADAVDLKVGDPFVFGNNPNQVFTISGIVDTPECCSGFIDNYPCYVNAESLNKINGPMLYGICMYAKNDKVTVKELKDVLPTEYKNSLAASIDRNGLRLSMTILANIFGGVGIAAAIVILIVSIIIIRYIIRSVIDKEYHLIGIYKALGKGTLEIYGIYFTSYLLTGILGIIIGVILGRPLAVYLGKNIVNGIAGFHLTHTTSWITVIIVIFMFTAIAFNIWYELRKVKMITPVEALAIGMKSSKKKINKSVIKNAHSAPAMAVNQLFKTKGMSILTIMILTTAFYICLLSGSIALSLNHYTKDKNIWENLPIFSGYIKAADTEDVTSYLDTCPDIKDYVGMDINLNSVEIKIDDCELSQDEANPMVYTNFTKDRYKDVPFTSGRVCTNPYEIAVSDQFLKKVGKSLGEYMTISINGKKEDFLIVGTYSSQMRGGINFYLQEQDLESLGAKADLSTILFFLKDGVSYADFEKEFKEHFQDSKIYDEFQFIIQEQNTINDIARPVTLVLFISFEAFGILNVINVIYTMNREYRRKYGILKAMGYGTGYICRQVLCQLTIEAVVATVLTIILQFVFSPMLFSLACGISYIYNPVWLNIAACGGNYILIMLITALMLIPVKHITPVELMEE